VLFTCSLFFFLTSHLTQTPLCWLIFQLTSLFFLIVHESLYLRSLIKCLSCKYKFFNYFQIIYPPPDLAWLVLVFILFLLHLPLQYTVLQMHWSRGSYVLCFRVWIYEWILNKQLYLGVEQVNEKQNRKRKGVSTNLTSRKAQRGELHWFLFFFN